MIYCTAAITTHEIPAGDVVERAFDVQAVLHTGEGGEPVWLGSCTVQIELRWGSGETGSAAEIERELIARP